jgi:hypothetical protein
MSGADGEERPLDDPAVLVFAMACQSMWALLDRALEERIVARLAAALASGAWAGSHGHLRGEDAFEGSLRPAIPAPG